MTVRRVFVIVVCALSFQACGAARPVAKVPVDRCAVASKVVAILVAEEGSRKVVFSDRDEQPLFSPIEKTDEWSSLDDVKSVKMPSPPVALVTKLNVTKPTSAVRACAVVRAALDKRGIAYGKNAVDKAIDSKRMTDGAYAETILGFSVPVISDDGADALFLSSGVAAPLGGGGYVRHLYRDAKGRWRLAAIHGLWVS